MVACSCSDPNTIDRLPGTSQQCRPSDTQMMTDNNVLANDRMTGQMMSSNRPMMKPYEQKKFPYGFIFVVIIIVFLAMYFMKKNSK